MSERRAVEKLVERIYKDRLKRTGRLLLTRRRGR